MVILLLQKTVNMKKWNILLAALLLATFTFAQDATLKNPDFSFGSGMRGSTGLTNNYSRYQALFPNSILLQDHYLTEWNFGPTNADMFNFLVGFTFKENQSYEQRLRFGITISGFTPVFLQFFQTNNFAFDTLTSARTGNSTFIDSVYREDLSLDITQGELGIDVSYLLKINHLGRWSLYGGLGLEVGTRLAGEAEITYETSASYKTAEGQGFYYSNRQSTPISSEKEFHQLNGGFYVQGYLPLGVDFRLGKEHELWQRVHLYLELRPTLRFSNADFATNTAQLSFDVAFFGIRATL